MVDGRDACETGGESERESERKRERVLPRKGGIFGCGRKEGRERERDRERERRFMVRRSTVFRMHAATS